MKKIVYLLLITILAACTNEYLPEQPKNLLPEEKFIEMIEKLNKNTAVYIFSWGDNEFTDEFNHITNVKVKTIPIPILEINKNIYISVVLTLIYYQGKSPQIVVSNAWFFSTEYKMNSFNVLTTKTDIEIIYIQGLA